jgi:LemA protein
MGKSALWILGIVVLVILFVVGIGAGRYNTLVSSRNTVDQQWAQVENNLQRRADLIGNLVGTVKGIAGQEKDVFIKIAEARSRLLGASSPEDKMAANEQLTKASQEAGLLPSAGGGGGGILGTGGRFLSIVEQYPQLRSSESFLKLQDELAGTENRLAVARKDYNDAVTVYNTTRQRFPTVLIAGLMGFQDKPFFKAEEGAKQVPKVDFSK